MLSKKCTKCNIEKPLNEFSRNSRNKTNGRQPKCKQCFRDYCIENSEKLKIQRAVYSKVNSDKAITRSSEWAKNNRDRSREIKTKWRENNSEKMKEIRNEWAKNNPEYLTFICRKYQISKVNASPKWADKKKMIAIYKESRRLSLETGIQHHVDHIVPITSDIVCGLHCEANLQILTFSENVKKGNRHWENMP